MAAISDDDSQQSLILGIAVGVIAFVLMLVVGIAIWKGSAAKAPAVAVAPIAPTARAMTVAPADTARPSSEAAQSGAPTVAVVTETVTAVVPEGAGITNDQGVVRFYFATGSTDLAPGAAEALAEVLRGVQAGRRAVISGYADRTGDAALNEKLAKQRAEAVRDVLVGLGVAADKIELKKPDQTTGPGKAGEARRVEVTLVE